jgi:DNA-binding NarL/FixJ family response regulator
LGVPRSLKEPETTSRPIPVVVIDGHDVARLGLRAIIAEADDLELFAQSVDQTDGLALLAELTRSSGAQGARRAVIVVDDAIAATPGSLEALRDAGPLCAVVVAAAAHDSGRLLAALRSGADGYVLKSSARTEILDVIRSAAAGRPAIDRELTASLLHDLASQERSPVPEPLTPRELEVLDGLAEGRTNKEIAGHLAVSMGTVKVHVEHILAKLGAAGRTEAAVRAVEMGMVPPRAAVPPAVREP